MKLETSILKVFLKGPANLKAEGEDSEPCAPLPGMASAPGSMATRTQEVSIRLFNILICVAGVQTHFLLFPKVRA